MVLAEGGREALKLFGEKLEAVSDVTPEAVYGCIQAVMEEQGIAMKVLANPLRVCVCAAGSHAADRQDPLPHRQGRSARRIARAL